MAAGRATKHAAHGRWRRIGAGLRPAAVTSALVVVELLALAAARDAARVVQAAGPASLDEAVVLVVLVGCAVLGAWAALTTTLAWAAHLPGQLGDASRRWSGTLAPPATRRLAALLVGAALGGTVAPGTAAGTAGGQGAAREPSPAFAITAPTSVQNTPRPTQPASSTPSSPVPGWTPSRPVHPSPPAARLLTSGSTPASTDVVVHRGDTLWSIARSRLGPGATDAEVAQAWPRWYAANRDVVGPDPDVLLPGQVLRPPERHPSSGHTVGIRP